MSAMAIGFPLVEGPTRKQLLRGRTLEEVIFGMKAPVQGKYYYSLRLWALPDGRVVHTVACTHWVRYSSYSPLREVREASLVEPAWWIDSWQRLGIPWHIVSDELQLMFYGCMGGAALVERELAEKYFPEDLREFEAVPAPQFGFRDVRFVPKESLCRAPSAKLRMKVLKRDGYRCRVCGRRAFDNTDLELHVHHIVPWSRGGLSEERNLITLCHTCHNGLSPHYDLGLFALMDKPPIEPKEDIRDFIEGVKRYCALTGAPPPR